ncbi:HEAT repeat domain-containing protein [Calothrix sp. PCC 6303]|uniref:HEAT repeat domain-containing protein n=1 Tax=Calothrix sp. PCC 6303 TaxID=1170562 RepID=UPI0002A046A9|nr:HEAT repeat domain-containing protein [Calothrix sp. PCC 6303]AFZ00445.1 HEAT domain containing protein [Calothrix sp. PCC 6303]
MNNLVKPKLTGLIKNLQNGDLTLRLDVIVTLSQMGKNAKNAVPALIAALSDSQLRYHIIIALGNIGIAANSAIPALIMTLQDVDEVIRAITIEALCKIGLEVDLIPSLVITLHDDSARVRANAAFAIGCLGEKAKLAIIPLVEILEDKDDWVRGNAVEALGKIGKDAEMAIPYLITALSDNYSGIRAKATLSLAYVAPENQAIPLLINMFGDSDARVRSAAADALGVFVNEVASVVIILKTGLTDKNIYVQMNVAKVLMKAGVEVENCLNIFVAALKQSDAIVRVTASLNIGVIAASIQDVINNFCLMDIEKIISVFEEVNLLISQVNLSCTKSVITSINSALQILNKSKTALKNRY